MTIIMMIMMKEYEREQVQGNKDKNESPSTQHRVTPLPGGAMVVGAVVITVIVVMVVVVVVVVVVVKAVFPLLIAMFK